MKLIACSLMYNLTLLSYTQTHTEKVSAARLDAVETLRTSGGAFSALQIILTVALLPIPTLELSSQRRSPSPLCLSQEEINDVWDTPAVRWGTHLHARHTITPD